MNDRRSTEFSPGVGDEIYLYTKGGEFSLNGAQYIGEYHRELGVPKTGPIPSSGAQQLNRLYLSQDQYTYDKIFKFKVEVLSFVDPKPHLYAPSTHDYSIGFNTRYFVEKVAAHDGYAIEINEAQYNKMGQPKGIDTGLYRSIQIQWKLTGKLSDIVQHNQSEVLRGSKVVPSLNYAISSFTEKAQPTF